jgi:hypothetical protein
MTLPFLLILTALVLTVVSAVTPRVPLWVAVLVLCLALLVR